MKKKIKLFGIAAVVVAVLLAIACQSVNASVENIMLNGTWDRGDIVITFSGTNAVFKEVKPNYRHIVAYNNGMIKIGDRQIRNVRKVEDLKWTGEYLYLNYETNSSGAITRYTGTAWRNCVIAMSANGQTIWIDNVDTLNRVRESQAQN